MTQSQYRIGFDVGGTFTDFVLQTPTGDLHTAKRLTTYPDPSEACLAGLDDVLARAGCPWAQLGQAVHGTTIGSNLVIERKGRDVALITTRGFRDVLIIGRSKRYQVYDLQIEKPAPLIRRRFIGEVAERVLADGRVREPLDEADAVEVPAGPTAPPDRAAASVDETLAAFVADKLHAPAAGLTLKSALSGLGYGSISGVRQGKYFEIALDAGSSREQAQKDIDTIARDVLTNPVIEEYRIEFLD